MIEESGGLGTFMRGDVVKLLVLLISLDLCFCSAFMSPRQSVYRSNYFEFFMQSDRDNDSSTSEAGPQLRKEAEKLLDKARALRNELPEANRQVVDSSRMSTPWNLAPDAPHSVDYRLYVDIGREEGTWMDFRWGASGRRIEFSLDVRFTTPSKNNDALANEEERERMVKDNFGGTSSDVWVLSTAPMARLRKGFDEMKCRGGAYRIDTARNGGSTARFYVVVDGTPEKGSPYGDVFIPQGNLYFSLPSFGGVSQLSKKEGLVTVRQIGWHTGWRREESRMVGTFRATPIEDAKRRDGF